MKTNLSPEKFLEQNSRIIVILVVLVAGLGIGFSQVNSRFPGLTASITGSQLCAIGADDVRISSNDPEVSGKSWIVEAAGGCSDHVIEGGALVDADDVTAKDPDSGDTAKATKDFEIGLTDFQGFAYNKIGDTNTLPTYTSEHKEYEGSGLAGGIVKEDLQACRQWQNSNSVSLYSLDQPHIQEGDDQYSNSDHTDFVNYNLVGNSVLHCYRAQNKEGEVGEFQSTTYSDWTGTFTMQAAGKTVDKTVTKEQAQGGITLGTGNQKAHIQYTGTLTNSILDINLDTGVYRPACDNNCNEPENQKSYKITKDSLVQDYKNSVNNFEQNAINAVDDGEAATASTTHNTYVDNIYQGYSSDLETSVGDWIDRTEFNADQFRIYGEDSDILGRPLFTFRIKADWIGFNVPIAEPKIESATDVSVDANGIGSSTSIVVNNNADVSGDVHASVSCPSPLQAGYDEGFIGAGSSQTFNVDVESGPSPDNTYTCDVYVKDKDAIGIQDSTTIDVDVAASCTDTDGDTVCDQNDGCIDEPGPVTNGGCPTGPEDSDGDGIEDNKDLCPTRSSTPEELIRKYDTSKEIYNGYEDSDGCPDEIQNPNEETQCNDGLDNDGDGLIDDADPDCDTSGGTPWALIIGGIISVMLVAVGLYYYRKPLSQSIRNFGVGQ